ncbi:MAG TPA: M1 family metallopeptidase [Chitinophagaceae bacterium]|nr:M1 family metallopeptidase [Chitinophagaceae bacterium]
MRKFFLLLLSYLLLATSHSQQNYWQQQVNYTIDVTLNDKDHTLDAFEKIEYINNSPDTLRFIWFHLWPNAYKNDKTAYTDQTLENGSTKFYFSDKEQKGYINRLDFKVNNITATVEDHPQHIDIVKLVLPAPLPPGQKIIISTPFHVRLPYNFSRGGHDGQSYQATQWYPKPAVYDKYGWHPMPYLDQGEFYSEFGSFDVSITVPGNYVVAATGELQNTEEKEWLKTRSSFSWTPVKGKDLPTGQAGKNSSGQIKSTLQLFPESSKENKTLKYKQANVHDFAWFADKRFIVNYDTCRLASGKVIDVFTYYTTQQNKAWDNSVKYAKDAVRHYSSLVGEYPYNIVQVVQGPESFGGGMEYPTITVISPTGNPKELDITIAHEIGHNWFYGILASNEREHPWMDEGINSYYDAKYRLSKYGKQPQQERILFESKAATKTDQPIELPSEKFSEANYGLVAYYKTAEWMRYLESQLGTEEFNKAMQEYFRHWQFKHPQPEDFKKAMEESSGKNLDPVFSYLGKTGTLPNQQRKGTGFIPAVMGDVFMQGPDVTNKNQIILSPYGLGFNSYDKFMIGPIITNYKLPPNRFQFFLAPMYATGSKKIRGLGLAYYSFYPNSIFRKIELGVNGSTFTADEFRDSDGRKTFLAFQKIVPGIKFVFKEKNPRSNFYRFIQFKSFLISEDQLRFYRDTVITLPGPDTTITNKYRTIAENRTLNQLKFVIENNRVLYPYRGELKIEQGKDFVRAAFTGNYFFNYPKGGGLNVRLFAGKFIYSGSKTLTKQFATDRYHLNMTGANGYEDYTYSDYFIGRNKFEGMASQQIMVRDGGFKVRTDLLADKVAKTDDWLIAANFSTTIPSAINPLSILPVKIPLKVFADIGTYAEAWKNKAENDRFLYDAGLQISLLNETINIYVPLIYSSVYRDYLQSTILKKERFFKKISFSIDISNFSLRKIDRNLVF